MRARQRHEHPGVEAAAASRCDFTMDKVDRALPVDGQHVIGKASQIHDVTPARLGPANGPSRLLGQHTQATADALARLFLRAKLTRLAPGPQGILHGREFEGLGTPL
jgi:hypothetical protein